MITEQPRKPPLPRKPPHKDIVVSQIIEGEGGGEIMVGFMGAGEHLNIGCKGRKPGLCSWLDHFPSPFYWEPAEGRAEGGEWLLLLLLERSVEK